MKTTRNEFEIVYDILQCCSEGEGQLASEISRRVNTQFNDVKKRTDRLINLGFLQRRAMKGRINSFRFITTPDGLIFKETIGCYIRTDATISY